MAAPEDASDRRDYGDEVRKHDSLVVRLVLAGLGAVCVLLGVAGLFLPVLPTTPFLLLAAALFARSSSRVYNWLLNHSLLGPVILEWREHRSMPWRAKRLALVLIAVSFSVSIVFFVRDWQAQLAMGLAGAALWLWIWRIPSRDRPGRG
ncbi:MAG: YbaN family protein [Thiobacillaceae bacterium]|jgi:hypothetical protein|nr:YbaN family protein [Thiobacillaceae bacterium]